MVTVNPQRERVPTRVPTLLEIQNKCTATVMHGVDDPASHVVAQWGRWERVQRKWKHWLTVWGLRLVSTVLSVNNYNSSVLHTWSPLIGSFHLRKTRRVRRPFTPSAFTAHSKCTLHLKPRTSALTWFISNIKEWRDTRCLKCSRISRGDIWKPIMTAGVYSAILDLKPSWPPLICSQK